MSTLVFPSLVRVQVLEQRVELRAMLEGALLGRSDTGGLADAARELCARFGAHLASEEEALKPVFAVLDTWGPERVRELESEHSRQRRRLDALLAKVESEEDFGRLALALRTLAADLLRDMAEEEQGCLRASQMSAGHLTFERR